VKLAGDVAVVTGAGSGIGRAVALALAREGASVGLVGRTAEKLGEVEVEISSAGGTALVAPADVTVRADVERSVRSVVELLGAPAILVNNAGVARSVPFAKTTVELWNEMITADLTSVFLVTQAALPHLLASGRGRIVSVASVAGLRGFPYVSAYCAAKHGVVGLTRALAAELADRNVTANAICPGYVDTPMTDRTLANIVEKTGMTLAEARAQIEKTSPQRRLIEPEEVAAMVLYLCSPEAKGVSGQAIPLCGGEVCA
jgi:3-hydroxybutyrate dehydrogenase